MTIDEAIAKEEKYIAVNKDKYEFECRYYGKDTVERGPKLDCVNEYEYHMKIVELLEELKAYKETKCNKSVYLANKSIDMIDAVNKGYEDGYNKAIDDLLGGMNQITYNCQDADELFEKICDLAEQLKAGGKNDNLRR